MNGSSGIKSYSAPILMMLVAISGVALAYFGYMNWQSEQRYKMFVPVTARVTDSSTRSISSGYGRNRSRRYETNVSFVAPTSSGDMIEGEMVLSNGLVHPEWGSETTWADNHWAPGTKFDLYLNPYNAKDWSLDQGPTRLTTLLLFGGLLMAAIGGIGFYPMLFKTFSGDPGSAYLPPDDPRVLAQLEERNERDRNRYRY